MAAVRDFRDAETSSAADAVDLAKKHLVQPWPYAGSIGTEARSLMQSGDGIYLIDGDGKRLIDGPAGMWCINVGHRREELARVMYDQAMELSYNTPWYTMNAPSAELSKRLADYAPGDLNHVFYTTGGSSAVETALRFMQFYNNVRGRPEKKLILSQRRRLSRLDLSVGFAERAAARPRLDGRRRRADRETVVARSVPAAERHDGRGVRRFPGRGIPRDGEDDRRGETSAASSASRSRPRAA